MPLKMKLRASLFVERLYEGRLESAVSVVMADPDAFTDEEVESKA